MDVPPEVVERLRGICGALPSAHEDDPWVGVRFQVRGRTFAHCVAIDEGRPVAMSRHARTRGPAVVLTFESSGEELGALRQAGYPFWVPEWRRNVMGMFLDDDTDWAEVTELVTESFCLQAPKFLAARVRQLPGG